MPLIRTQYGHSIAAVDGQSVLDAAASAGVQIAYSCRNGRCGSCKCKILSGDSISLHDEQGLSAEERQAGWILSCARTAITDLALEIDDLSGLVLPAPRTLPSRIHALERLSPDVVRVRLRLPPTADFRFLPGQYLQIVSPRDGVRRSYSIACATAEDHQLELHIRLVAGGIMSDYWSHAARVGDVLRFYGPLGTFTLQEGEATNVVFLATGTGIAPVKAMLESVARLPLHKQPRSLQVYWGGRSRPDFYLDLTTTAADFTYIPVLSGDDESWPGARGHVQNAVLANHRTFDNVSVYACGSERMIRSAYSQLTAHGLPAKRFKSDAFVCSA